MSHRRNTTRPTNDPSRKGVPSRPRDKTSHKAAVACLQNAVDLADSADLLHKAGKVGVAIALYVLACEELSKGQSYRSTADGSASFDSNDIGKKWVFDRKFLSEHELKHLQSVMSAMVPRLQAKLGAYWGKLLSSMTEAEMESMFTEGIPEQAKERLSAVMEADKEFSSAMRELVELGRKMEGLKQRGFYVDIRDGEVLTPRHLLETDYAQLREHFHTVLAGYSGGIVGDISPERMAFSAWFMERLIPRQVRPTGRGFKRGNFADKR